MKASKSTLRYAAFGIGYIVLSFILRFVLKQISLPCERIDYFTGETIFPFPYSLVFWIIASFFGILVFVILRLAINDLIKKSRVLIPYLLIWVVLSQSIDILLIQSSWTERSFRIALCKKLELQEASLGYVQKLSINEYRYLCTSDYFPSIPNDSYEISVYFIEDSFMGESMLDMSFHTKSRTDIKHFEGNWEIDSVGTSDFIIKGGYGDSTEGSD